MESDLIFIEKRSQQPRIKFMTWRGTEKYECICVEKARITEDLEKKYSPILEQKTSQIKILNEELE